MTISARQPGISLPTGFFDASTKLSVEVSSHPFLGHPWLQVEYEWGSGESPKSSCGLRGDALSSLGSNAAIHRVDCETETTTGCQSKAVVLTPMMPRPELLLLWVLVKATDTRSTIQSAVATATIKLSSVALPSAGFCKISPSDFYKTTTLYQLECTDSTIDGGRGPLRFTYSVSVDGAPYAVVHDGQNPTVGRYLPPGNITIRFVATDTSGVQSTAKDIFVEVHPGRPLSDDPDWRLQALRATTTTSEKIGTLYSFAAGEDLSQATRSAFLLEAKSLLKNNTDLTEQQRISTVDIVSTLVTRTLHSADFEVAVDAIHWAVVGASVAYDGELVRAVHAGAVASFAGIRNGFGDAVTGDIPDSSRNSQMLKLQESLAQAGAIHLRSTVPSEPALQRGDSADFVKINGRTVDCEAPDRIGIVGGAGGSIGFGGVCDGLSTENPALVLISMDSNPFSGTSAEYTDRPALSLDVYDGSKDKNVKATARTVASRDDCDIRIEIPQPLLVDVNISDFTLGPSGHTLIKISTFNLEWGVDHLIFEPFGYHDGTVTNLDVFIGSTSEVSPSSYVTKLTVQSRRLVGETVPVSDDGDAVYTVQVGRTGLAAGHCTDRIDFGGIVRPDGMLRSLNETVISDVWVFVQNRQSRPAKFQVRRFASSCRYFDETSQTWLSAGCAVSSRTTPAVLRCNCDHLTTFSGQFYVSPELVEFSPIDPEDLGRNPVVLVVVVVVWAVYLSTVALAMRRDRRRETVGEAIVLQSESSHDQGFYEVIISTGIRPSAGCSGDIFIQLTGETGLKSPFMLVAPPPGRTICQRQSVEVVLLPTPFDLGAIQAVTLRLVGGNPSGSWFVRRIQVTNVTNGSRVRAEGEHASRYFPAGEWLGTGVVGAEFERTFTGETSFLDATAFTDRVVDSFVMFHLWASPFFKAPTSRFSRAERVTVLFTFVFLALAANAAFFNSGAALGREFLAELYVATASVAVAVTPSLALVILFSRSAHRRRERNVSGSQSREEMAAHPRLRGPLQALASRMSEAHRRHHRRRQFPVLCDYLAWVISIALMGTASYILVAYSIQWGSALSLMWFNAFWLSMLTAVFVADPVIVVIAAIASQYFHKSTGEKVIHDDEDHIRFATSRDERNARQKGQSRQEAVVDTKAQLERRRKAAEVGREMLRRTKHVLLYALFYTALVVAVHRGAMNKAEISASVFRNFAGTEPWARYQESPHPMIPDLAAAKALGDFHRVTKFAEIDTLPDVWDWLETSFVSGLYWGTCGVGILLCT